MLVEPGDVQALAGAIGAAQRLDRYAVRRHAELTCWLDRMVDGYERCYDLVAGGATLAGGEDLHVRGTSLPTGRAS